MYTRRNLLKATAAGGLVAGASSLLPAWARSATAGNKGIFEFAGNSFDLSIGRRAVEIGGRTGHAITVNGTLPGPLLRFREGENLKLRVRNMLEEDTSIHWHGLLVPFYMDGVPGVSFPGIKPGETFAYEFALPQNGTYWYHSHSGLQEQSGHYGPIIIDPAGRDQHARQIRTYTFFRFWTHRGIGLGYPAIGRHFQAQGGAHPRYVRPGWSKKIPKVP